MILLRPDCLVFKTATGESIPCSVDKVTVEFIGAGLESLDKDLVRNAALAVLHYFKEELGRNSVSVAEFSTALEQALSGLGVNGLNLKTAHAQGGPLRIAEADLLGLAFQSGKGCELFFFQSLREELRRKLGHSPQILCFRRLRVCVKQLIGARRWNRRCQNLNDQIVEYLRTCLSTDKSGQNCALVVS
jgi:hypothetical protein